MPLTAQLDRAYDLSRNTTFQHRIAVALLDMVATVAIEPGGTVNHANRLAFAAQVVYNPTSWADKMALGCLVSNANMQNAISSGNADTNNAAVADADIKASVAVVWNFFSDSVATLQTAARMI